MSKNETINNLSPGLIFLYGSGRSGTTWLEERIASALGAEVVFEPLNTSVSRNVSKYAYRYLNVDDNETELEILFQMLISGKIWNLWTRYRILQGRLIPNKFTFLIFAEFKAWLKHFPDVLVKLYRYSVIVPSEKKIIKLIRANLLFIWLMNKFPNALHLYMVRHPVSVIESRMRLDLLAKNAGILTGLDDWSALKMLKKYQNNSNLPYAIKNPLEQIDFSEELYEIDYQCILWCVENKLALDACLSNNIIVIYYEHLLNSDSKAWDNLAKLIGVEKYKLTNKMSVPSQQASGNFEINISGNHIKSMDKLLKIAGDDCLEILEYYLNLFNIKTYVTNKLYPLETGL